MLTNLDIQKLVLECKKQKADSQKQLYQHYFGEMMGICRRYVSSTEDAEELLNQGFLKIFVNIDKFEDRGSFEGWMKRTMTNTCLDFFKSKSYKENKQIGYQSDILYNPEKEAKLFELNNYNESLVEDKYEKDELLATLNLLLPIQKTIFNLIVFEEYTHKQVAQELDIAERTSQWHFTNAKKIIFDKLTKERAQKANKEAFK